MTTATLVLILTAPIWIPVGLLVGSGIAVGLFMIGAMCIAALGSWLSDRGLL